LLQQESQVEVRIFYKEQEGWQKFTSPYAAVNGLKSDHPDVRTIIAIGGQGSLVISVEGNKWEATSSPLCAAGTGQFLEQQASRLRTPIEQFGDVALEWASPPPQVASRCSVFAKSDLVSLQQTGLPLSALFSGLADSVARMTQAQWRGDFIPPIYFIGGVAANKGVERALSRVLRTKEIIVPLNYEHQEAIGAARLSTRLTGRPTNLYPQKTGESRIYCIPNQLKPESSSSEWRPRELEPGITEVYLGVDVGSTSTKAVIINRSGEVLFKIYVRTAGQPLEAVKQVMTGLAEAVGDKVKVKAAGVTGSGRMLVGHLVGVDLIKNEITAQSEAARHIDPEATTIFELGGQDSKFVQLENGIMVDEQMNKACAAGTGSAIEETAALLGVSTNECAGLAFAAKEQLHLGEKCASFMGQAVIEAQQAGVPIENIIASLPTTLAQNYLAKVVGLRPIGERIILTGAVFCNAAVVSAFRIALPDRQFVIPEHKEVTGAIGVALLAKKRHPEGAESSFLGFSEVAELKPNLRHFNCHRCENTCAITMLVGADGNRYFQGSRCDRYDVKVESGEKSEKRETPFTEREKLLFENYDPEKGTGPVVGIPRALMAYDLAPMLTGFLNSLGVRVRYTTQTTNKIKEEASRHAYTSSCLPVKLLHGHVAELLKDKVDYVLIPNAIRLGEKTSEADQRFACPWVQAAPYIVNEKFELGEKLLDPVIDFSRGEKAVVKSFIGIARRLGFSKKKGKEAIKAGFTAQKEYEAKSQEEGKRILDELAGKKDAIGVVLLSRPYNSQDSGANLNITGELSRLGVIPIPLDFLPLDSVDISGVTDRAYWNSERKHLAGALYITQHPELFALVLSNFGCGPNSFILKKVKDIMGSKPMTEIEVDEHVGEANIITRLEAFTDELKEYREANFSSDLDPARYRRRVSVGTGAKKVLFIPRMTDHADVLARAMRAFGVNAQVLPESNEESVFLSQRVTSGQECLPFRDTLGGILLAAQEGRIPAEGAQMLMASSFGPCRIGNYPQEIQKILDREGIPVDVLTTASDNSYADLGLNQEFEILAWKGIVATDLLQKMLWSTRPYEKETGKTKEAYQYYLKQITEYTEGKRSLKSILQEAAQVFSDLRDPSLPSRPLVGINGEIYVRANSFCNQHLVEACEAAGLEVEVASMAEWIRYIHLRRVEDAWQEKDFAKLGKSLARKWVTEFLKWRMSSWAKKAVHEKEHSPWQLVGAAAPYIPGRNGNESILSIGSGVLQMKDRRFAGVISTGPHLCMPGGIVASFAESLPKRVPWISLTYDGFSDTVNKDQIATFAEQIRSQRN